MSDSAYKYLPQLKWVVAELDYYNIKWRDERAHDAYDKRVAGHVFTLQEHVEALVLSLLSANRPWFQIENNLDNIAKIFHGYNPDYLSLADPNKLVEKICSIDCGNRSIYKQMESLKHNISVLRKIDVDYGSVDAFAVEAIKDPMSIAIALSLKDGMYKLKNVGQALALEYLKHVGVDCVKPDVHIRRMLQRWGYFSYTPSEIETFDFIYGVSKNSGMLAMDIGSAMWNFCAKNYLEVCTASPRCRGCTVQCKSSIGDCGNLRDLVVWGNYLSNVDDVLAECERLTAKYETENLHSLLVKMGLI